MRDRRNRAAHVRAAALAWSVLIAAGGLGCGSDGGNATASARFERDVLPVLTRRCASPVCHGVAAGAEERGDVVDWSRLLFQLDGGGRIADTGLAYQASKRTINTIEDPSYSSLLRKPLPLGFGGLPHFGRAGFSSPDDPSYRTIREWIAAEEDGGEDPEPLDDLEKLFADTVQPVLREVGCMTSQCHGLTKGAIPYSLDPGYQRSFPIVATRHNYERTLSQVSLDGYPWQSRLLRKSLPLHDGGVTHKGTNADFYSASASGGREAIVRWICAERRARTGEGCKEDRDIPISGFVFVRGPVTPHDAFELDVFAPPRDLYLATVEDDTLLPTRIENLTAALHPAGPADIRDPAVSPAGDRVLFSMRTGADTGHHIYELDLRTKQARRLTFGNDRLPGGGMATDRDPTWGPDGTVWFVSTRAGRMADGGRFLDAEIYSLDPEMGARRWSYTPHIERKPVFLSAGEVGGEIAFTALRDVFPNQSRAHSFRFPPDLHVEYHQHFGITPLADLFFDVRELPDGRYVNMVGSLGDVWRAGRLGIVDRNLGPEINEQSDFLVSSLESYVPPFVLLDPASQPIGAYRDPAPIPDGRILFAYHPGPIDLADATAEFEPRIEILRLSEATDGSGPSIGERRVLVEMRGAALTDPEPIFTRTFPKEPSVPLAAPPGETTGLLLHQGLPMIDAILASLPPTGELEPREDFHFARLVEALPRTPETRFPIEPSETRFGINDATTTTLGHHGPARILAELPLAADGSFQARIPAGVPFRIQGLNEDRMAVGVPHNRWLYLLPGQTMRQGISFENGPHRFGSSCAACHGNADGVGGRPPELEEPDMMTTASLTLSRYENQNPHRPIAAPGLGDSTRIEVDFLLDVEPILVERCATAGCHAGESPAGGLTLTDTPTNWFTDAYENLLAPETGTGGGYAYVDAANGQAVRSFLIEMLLGRELDAPRELARPGAAHPTEWGGAPLTDAEVRTLIRWIDLGAAFEGTAEAAP